MPRTKAITISALVIALLASGVLADNNNAGNTCWAYGLSPADGEKALRCNYYGSYTGCVKSVVASEVLKALTDDPTNAGPLLRLHFHDCFVNGCDGSVLLQDLTTSNAERDAPPNLTLDGFDIVDGIKAAVDATCTDQVSCADILALVAAEVVHQTGGPKYDVPLGRLDGCTSQKDVAPNYLPSGHATVRNAYNDANQSLLSAFKVQGLNAEDLVALSGAHTIGQAHCPNFKDRICYNQTSPMPIDQGLQKKLYDCCVSGFPKGSTCDAGSIDGPIGDAGQVELERGTPAQSVTYPPTGGGLTFDNSYFKNIKARMALLTSDQALYYDAATKGLVELYAANQEAFFKAFVKSMIRMGNILPANMGVQPGADMQVCGAYPSGDGNSQGQDNKDLSGFFKGFDKLYAPACGARPLAVAENGPTTCLAYSKNLYYNRRGKCSQPATECSVGK